MFRVGDTVRYYDRWTGRIYRIDDYIYVQFEHFSRAFGLEGVSRRRSGYFTTPDGVPFGDPGTRLTVVPRFFVGQRVHYQWSDGSADGTVREITDDGYVVISEWSGGLQRWDTRCCGLNGRTKRGGPHISINSNSQIIPLEEPSVMTDFKVGDRYIYLLEDGQQTGGMIDEIDDSFIYFKLDEDTAFRYPTFRRLFYLDGTWVGSFYGKEGCRGSERYSRLIKEARPWNWEPTPGREYPPEPFIGYGVFDGHGKQVPEGYVGDPLVGYGILNLPEGVRSIVRDEQDGDLERYLTTAKNKWRENCQGVDFDAIENKLELLNGLELRLGRLQADMATFTIRFPAEVDPMQRTHSIVFVYGVVGLFIGLKTPSEVQAFFANYIDYVPMKVKGDKIAVGDFEFHLTSRYRFDVPPTVEATPEVKALLLRNMDMQRELRDSQDASDVALAA